RSPDTHCLRSSSTLSFLIYSPSSTEIYTPSLHDALPIFKGLCSDAQLAEEIFQETWLSLLRSDSQQQPERARFRSWLYQIARHRSEEHTSELQSRENLVCRLLLE